MNSCLWKLDQNQTPILVPPKARMKAEPYPLSFIRVKRSSILVIDKLSTHAKGLVFMLWGNYAKQKGKHIDRNKHLVLEAGHPSPLSANRGLWFGNKHFSKANTYLVEQGKTAIDW